MFFDLFLFLVGIVVGIVFMLLYGKADTLEAFAKSLSQNSFETALHTWIDFIERFAIDNLYKIGDVESTFKRLHQRIDDIEKAVRRGLQMEPTTHYAAVTSLMTGITKREPPNITIPEVSVTIPEGAQPLTDVGGNLVGSGTQILPKPNEEKWGRTVAHL